MSSIWFPLMLKSAAMNWKIRTVCTRYSTIGFTVSSSMWETWQSQNKFDDGFWRERERMRIGVKRFDIDEMTIERSIWWSLFDDRCSSKSVCIYGEFDDFGKNVNGFKLTKWRSRKFQQPCGIYWMRLLLIQKSARKLEDPVSGVVGRRRCLSRSNICPPWKIQNLWPTKVTFFFQTRITFPTFFLAKPLKQFGTLLPIHSKKDKPLSQVLYHWVNIECIEIILYFCFFWITRPVRVFRENIKKAKLFHVKFPVKVRFYQLRYAAPHQRIQLKTALLALKKKIGVPRCTSHFHFLCAIIQKKKSTKFCKNNISTFQ